MPRLADAKVEGPRRLPLDVYGPCCALIGASTVSRSRACIGQRPERIDGDGPRASDAGPETSPSLSLEGERLTHTSFGYVLGANSRHTLFMSTTGGSDTWALEGSRSKVWRRSRPHGARTSGEHREYPPGAVASNSAGCTDARPHHLYVDSYDGGGPVEAGYGRASKVTSELPSNSFRRVTPGDRGELRNCPTNAARWSESRPNFDRGRPTLAKHWPIWVNIGQKLAQIGSWGNCSTTLGLYYGDFRTTSETVRDMW